MDLPDVQQLKRVLQGLKDYVSDGGAHNTCAMLQQAHELIKMRAWLTNPDVQAELKQVYVGLLSELAGQVSGLGLDLSEVFKGPATGVPVAPVSRIVADVVSKAAAAVVAAAPPAPDLKPAPDVTSDVTPDVAPESEPIVERKSATRMKGTKNYDFEWECAMCLERWPDYPETCPKCKHTGFKAVHKLPEPVKAPSVPESAPIVPKTEETVPEEPEEPEEPKKRKRGRPRKKKKVATIPLPEAAPVVDPDQPGLPFMAEEGEEKSETGEESGDVTSMLSQELDKDSPAVQEMRPPSPYKTPPVQDDSLDYHVSELTCDNPECQAENLIARVPSAFAEQTRVSYRCQTCQHEGYLYLDVAECEHLVKSASIVDYAVLQKEGKDAERAKKKKSRKKRTKKEIAAPEPTEAERESKAAFVPEKASTELDAETSALLEQVLASPPVQSVDLKVARGDLMTLVRGWEPSKLVKEWETHTRKVYDESVSDEQMVMDVAAMLTGEVAV